MSFRIIYCAFDVSRRIITVLNFLHVKNNSSFNVLWKLRLGMVHRNINQSLQKSCSSSVSIKVPTVPTK